MAFNATTGAVDTAFAPNVGAKEVIDVVDAGDGTAGHDWRARATFVNAG